MIRAQRICIEPGCPNTTPDRRCSPHEAEAQAAWASPRKRFYSTKRWKTVRRNQLRAHPYCQQPGCMKLATQVDHITPLRDGGDPYAATNLQSLCKPHHSAKTAREVWHTN